MQGIYSIFRGHKFRTHSTAGQLSLAGCCQPNQLFAGAWIDSYDYTQADVTVTYEIVAGSFGGTLTATNPKPNFAYQLKLSGIAGTPSNEDIGLAGRWWQEQWNGTQWANGQNLNNKGDGSSPNPNDVLYFARRDIPSPTSPTGLMYKFTGYLVFDYFITDENGDAIVSFETDSSYHVLWATNDSDGNDGIGHRDRSTDDGPLKESTFDADLSLAYDDTGGDDFPPRTVAIFGEWERLPVGGVFPEIGDDFVAQLIITEESFHGSGGQYAGNWAAAMSAEIGSIIVDPIPLPSEAAYGLITGGDQSHINEVRYGLDGEPGDLLVAYEVWDVDFIGEVEIKTAWSSASTER